MKNPRVLQYKIYSENETPISGRRKSKIYYQDISCKSSASSVLVLLHIIIYHDKTGADRTEQQIYKYLPNR
jgi:hypothetical protein